MSETFNPNFLDQIDDIARKLLKLHGKTNAEHAQAMCVAEEAGEFLKMARRHLGLSRTPPEHSHYLELIEECADVVISACVASVILDFDIEAAVNEKMSKIFQRGGI